MQLMSQRDPRWAAHPLGWGPALGTIGAYGCYLTCLAMIANDSDGFKGTNPASLDDAFMAAKLFVRDQTGTLDLLPDNALAQLRPGRFTSVVYPGFRPDVIGVAVRSPDTYAVLWISTAAVPTHFVIAWSADARVIADPWTGKLGLLSGYGGPQAVHKVIAIRKLKPAALPVPTPTVSPLSGAPVPVPSPVPATVIAPIPGGKMPTFTAFDKAILAAVMGPLIVLGTSYVNGSQLGSSDLIAAVVAAVVAGLAVYLKGNKSST